MSVKDDKQRYCDQVYFERTFQLTFSTMTAAMGLTGSDTCFFRMPDPFSPFFDFFEFLRCSMLNSKAFVEQCCYEMNEAVFFIFIKRPIKPNN